MSDPIVQVQSLHKYFGDHHVLQGVDLEVERGEMVCMIGSSGSGKSTFLRCVNFHGDSQRRHHHPQRS